MAGSETELLCIGNALVDVFARGEASMAVRYGINRPVQHIGIDKLQGALSGLSGTVMTSGGGAANVAKIAGLLGARTGFIGTAGSDKAGQLFQRDLSAAGVKLYLPLKPSPTGICLVLKIDDSVRIAASPSAALELSESDISGETIQNAKVVVIDGFMFDRPPLVRHILRLTGQYGIPAALDLSSPAIAGEQAAKIAGYIQEYPLILFMNEAEARAFYCGLKAVGANRMFDANKIETNIGDAEIHTAFRSLAKGKLIIVEKLGERGALVFAEETIHRAETQAVTPLETTGAGDAFAAGFLTAWVRNKPLLECADLGNKTARIVLDVVGTQVDGKRLKEIAP